VLDAARGLMTDSRTYLRILYLLLAFPLGILYFTVIVTGLSVGLGLAIVIVGFLVLILTLLVWLVFARIEPRTPGHELAGPGDRPSPSSRVARERPGDLLHL
jgi:Putative sensor